MRITRDMLLKIADDTVAERTKADPGILSVYLHGALLGQEPLMGGTADIDLTFVYAEGDKRREIVRLTDEVHLDISHHPQSMYADGRTLREMAWEGSAVYHCKILHDPKHFFDFTQANVRGMFERPETVIKRAQPCLETARRAWLRFNSRTLKANAGTIGEYLEALEKTANDGAAFSVGLSGTGASGGSAGFGGGFGSAAGRQWVRGRYDARLAGELGGGLRRGGGWRRTAPPSQTVLSAGDGRHDRWGDSAGGVVAAAAHLDESRGDAGGNWGAYAGVDGCLRSA
ncbi:MAG: hypothetical protein IH859_07395 [Chloroflexi bacterium]|nr:hypothetical protein [Chloroflexota bacterium]